MKVRVNHVPVLVFVQVDFLFACISQDAHSQHHKHNADEEFKGQSHLVRDGQLEDQYHRSDYEQGRGVAHAPHGADQR